MVRDEELQRFRLTVRATLVAAVLLVVLGGIVRVSDSGLGCGPEGSGLHGWPLCQGGLVPSAGVRSAIEYAHRVLAAAVVVLLVAMLWQALRRLRGERALAKGALVAVALVLAQAILGALTVEHGLRTALVAAHLGAAMLLLATLVCIDAAARRPRGAPDSSPRLRLAGVLASVLLLAAIVAGGVVAGTEEHGRPGGEATEGAHLACGREFPTCNGALLPYGADEMVDIQLAHRTAMFLATLAILAMAALLRRARWGESLSAALIAVVCLQILLGATNVWAGESQALVVAHLTVATLLWLVVAEGVARAFLGAPLWPGERPRP